MAKIKENVNGRYIPYTHIFLVGFVICFMLLFAGIGGVSAMDHPFLIVNESDYAELQARATNSPGKEMKTDAIFYVSSHSYDPSNKISSMDSITSAGAMAYILDPTNRTAYKNTVRDALKHWDDIYADRDSGWFFCMWAGSAFFNSVLALDIIHDDLTSAERADIEGKLDMMAEWYWSGGSSYWPLNRYAVIGVWALYQGDRNRINSAKNSYYSTLMSYLTTDGVFTSGTGYAWARLSSDRDAKAYFMDVLEFTNEGTYYSDPKIRKFYEWLYQGGSTPFYKNPTFGDSDPHRNVEGQWGEAAAYRAHRFSVQAAQNAAWIVNGVAPNARLLNYVLMDQPLPPAEKPLSCIWPDGGAAFWEDNTSSRSLMGGLWNCKSDYSGSHAHKDVNALHLAAYGEHVLRNSGYTGWGQGAHGFSWSYLHDTAVSGNTVLIDDLDHVRKDGGGILEGFTALESSGTDVITHGGVSFRGLASLYRRSRGNVTFYFVREGRVFDNGTSPRHGFSSNLGVSLYMKDKQGKIVSPGTDAFYYPGISTVLLGGVAAPVVESGTGWIKVTVASGTHDLEFLTGGTVPLSAST